MRDERGIYYFAEPGNTKARVYVKKGKNGEILFRLWEADHPEVWEGHPWLSYDIITQAASLYREERNSNSNPLRLYDMAVAKNLLANETSGEND